MKILYHHRIASRDGQAVHVRELIRALREQGHDVFTLGYTDVGDAGHEGSKNVVPAIRRILPRLLYEFGEVLYSFIALLRVLLAGRRFGPDAIYERSSLFVPFTYLVAKHLNCPLLLEINAPFFTERKKYSGLSFERLATWGECLSWRKADFCLPVSNVLANIIASHDIVESKIIIVRNGVDEAWLTDDISCTEKQYLPALRDRVVMGFTGFPHSWQALDEAVRLLARPEQSLDLHLLLVGDSAACAELLRLAQSLGVQDRVTVTGVVKREEVAGYVLQYDIAVLLATNPYACPMKLVEYMALGRAIVAPDCQNIRELVEHEETALLFEPGNMEAFAQAVDRLAGDAELRTRLGGRARARAEAMQLTWQKNAERVTQLIEKWERV